MLMRNRNIAFKKSTGFSLIELITVMILLSILSITLFTRMGPVNTAAVQSGRDDLIAALFFAQQQAMMRSNISLVLTANSVSVNENSNPIVVSNDFYPLTMPAGVSLPALTLNYDKLGRTTATQIVLTGSGNSSGVTATIQVDISGYAYAQ
jgi:MSHA pilin protein MshC